MSILVAALLIGLAAYVRCLQLLMWHLPLYELKRRARHDKAATLAVYRVRAYDQAAGLFLSLLNHALLAIGLVTLVRAWSWLAGFAVLVLVVLAWYGWFPARQPGLPGPLVQLSAGVVEWLVRQVYFALKPLSRWTTRLNRSQDATGIFDKDDLLAWLDRQKGAKGNRVEQEELAIARRALKFSDKKVCDHMTPRRKVHAIESTAAVGPILMDELHKSGHSRFPVYDKTNPERTVGILHMQDLVGVKDNKIVRDVMREEVHYVHEDDGLGQALQAFFKSKQSLFVVNNSFKEVSGIITIEDILEQIVGHKVIE